jgi:hypothetical protein
MSKENNKLNTGKAHDANCTASVKLGKLLENKAGKRIKVQIGQERGQYRPNAMQKGKLTPRLNPAEVASPKMHGDACTEYTVTISQDTAVSHLFDVVASALNIVRNGKTNTDGRMKAGRGTSDALDACKVDLETNRQAIEECGLVMLERLEVAAKDKAPTLMSTIKYYNGDSYLVAKVADAKQVSRKDGVVQYNKDGSIKYEIVPTCMLGTKKFTIQADRAEQMMQEHDVQNKLEEIDNKAKADIADSKDDARWSRNAATEAAKLVQKDIQAKARAAKATALKAVVLAS